MEVRAYLEQVERLDLQIASAEQRVKRLKRKATSTTASMGGERVSSSGNMSKVADAVAEYSDIERDEIKPLKRQREAILANLKRVRGRASYIVLYEHYFNYKSLKQIALERNYSYSHVKNEHLSGLAKLQKIIGE